ncbi:MAG TPA: aromatic-ring-hydroxylating dioxygenase subunit beta [Stellaceae bacterium]|nr:aromatic-ring-hydroxylating dioxygenase subunit beta [Stellaceae bacterium]
MQLEAVVRRLELEQLYTDYVHCLDADELEHWPDFFTEDCFYRVTSAENYEAGLPLGLIHATSRNMLKDRVSALREANIYEPQRYRHIVSSIKIVEEHSVALDLVANFLVVRTMQEGDMTLFGAGRYVDQVRQTDEGWKFARKDVVLDSRQIDTLLAIPI